MKRTLLSIAAVGALLASGIYAFGDIARPKPSPAQGKVIFYSGLTVTSDPKAYEARLQISQDTLKRLTEAANREGGSSSLTQNIMHSSTRTMMAGVFMFLAISFGGVWLARSNQKRNTKAIAAVLAIAFMFGLATVIVRANAGPPGYIRWQNLPTSLQNGKETAGGVEVELVPGDDSMKLIIPLRPKRAGE
jgi:hypothetical protein